MVCQLLNISYCPPSEIDFSGGKSLASIFSVLFASGIMQMSFPCFILEHRFNGFLMLQILVVYNSLGWKRDDIVRIPVITEDITVHNSEGKVVKSQILPLADAHVSVRNYYVKAYLGETTSVRPKYWLAFPASVPPLGFSTYTIASGGSSTRSSIYTLQTSDESSFEVAQGNLKLTFSTREGKLTHYVNDRTSVKQSVEQSYSFYSAYNGTEKDPQASGAYIFRPNGTFLIGSEKQAPLTVVHGPLIDEVHHQINPWIHQINRLYNGKEHVEVEFTVGPIPVDDGVGKEVVTQLTTTMVTNKTFYTDSSGRDFIKRIRDYRTDWNLEVNQPVAGNYYPINLGIYVQDNTSEFSVLVDRSVGGSSILDGQIELMLHRRLLHDDSRGVAEALNETDCIVNECRGLTIQGKYYFRIDPLGQGARWRHSYGQEIYSPFLLAFTEEDGGNWMGTHVHTFSGFDSSYSLPDNVAMITLEELNDGKVLLRLAHLYEIDEDKDLSTITKVELKKLFLGKKISKVMETNLSANQERAEMEKKRLVWKVEGEPGGETQVIRGGPVDPKTLVVELAPMEIRTFIIHFDSSFFRQ
ncbi:Glycosyl hydrolase family 38, C-terminal, partial [Dillenia turbinata]